jgi:hypothetical protein
MKVIGAKALLLYSSSDTVTINKEKYQSHVEKASILLSIKRNEVTSF